jgi:hypothetical protein
MNGEQLKKALRYFNSGIHQWYGWKNLEDGEVYSNIKVLDDNAVLPSEEEINQKIAELEFVQNRKDNYPQLGEQFDKLWHDINNGTLDNTGEFFTALKEVKDNNPKPGA